MNLNLLQQSLTDLKRDLETVITSGIYTGRQNITYAHGLEAKTAFIRSQNLIMRLHEVVKFSLHAEISKYGRPHIIYPELGRTSPEVSLTGYIKAKKQDIVVLFDGDKPLPEVIIGGPLNGMIDRVGATQSQRAIAVSIRSQLSSVNKNFDTLMERALAEALNFHLRHPLLVMGEVYLLPVFEYDPRAMINNTVKFLPNKVDIEKFVRTFFGISGRPASARTVHDDVYKYERSALVLVDFRCDPPTLFLTLQALKDAGLVSSALQREINDLSPRGFVENLVKTRMDRQ